MTLHAESGTITIDVTVEPAYPRAGELVHFRLNATDTEGGLFSIGFNPGDRRIVSRPGSMIVDCSAREPGAPPRERSAAQKMDEFTYTYRVAAERHFEVVVATAACDRGRHSAELAGNIVVRAAGGKVPSNGPRPPEGWVHQNAEGAPPSGVWMSIAGSDPDGLVRRVTVDWGDGTKPSVLEVPPGDDDCIDEPTAYPRSGDTHGMEHVYASPGTYTVTATVMSVGCDGKHPQSATATATAAIEAATSG